MTLLLKPSCSKPTAKPSGVKYPLRWVPAIQAKSTPQQRWRVMLDAAAYVPTQPLDLSAVRPDFVSLSFYKVRVAHVVCALQLR